MNHGDHHDGTSKVLFICTGNHYRSRFAEAVFNHHAGKLGIPWQAESRGLATYLVPDHLTLSGHTKRALADRGIHLNHTADEGRQLSEQDLRDASIRIAIKESEHRPMLRRQFPLWENRVEYWHVSDEAELTPSLALPALEHKVLKLVEQCWMAERKKSSGKLSDGSMLPS